MDKSYLYVWIRGSKWKHCSHKQNIRSKNNNCWRNWRFSFLEWQKECARSLSIWQGISSWIQCPEHKWKPKPAYPNIDAILWRLWNVGSSSECVYHFAKGWWIASVHSPRRFHPSNKTIPSLLRFEVIDERRDQWRLLTESKCGRSKSSQTIR